MPSPFIINSGENLGLEKPKPFPHYEFNELELGPLIYLINDLRMALRELDKWLEESGEGDKIPIVELIQTRLTELTKKTDNLKKSGAWQKLSKTTWRRLGNFLQDTETHLKEMILYLNQPKKVENNNARVV